MRKKSMCLLFLFSGIIFCANSQTLQFSKVKLVTSTEETVPAGKVWKIEGIGAARVKELYHKISSTSSFTPADQQITINGTSISVIQTVGTGAGIMGYTSTTGTYATSASYAASATWLPIWLPENTTLKTGTNVEFISVIEFTVLP